MQWLELQIASERSGLTVRHIRRLCAETLAEGGVARLINDGRPRWQVAETADPRFTRVKMPDYIDADLREVRQIDRDEAYRRRNILNDWQRYVSEKLNLRWTKADATDRFIAEHPDLDVSRPTLYRWEKLFRLTGIAGLLPRYLETSNFRECISEQAIGYFRTLYLTQNKLGIAICHKIVVKEAQARGWQWFGSLRSCQRWVKDAFTKAEIVLLRQGEAAYNAECAPYLERDPEQFAGNECWVGDHHQMDLWCTYKGKLLRPWITGWMDMRSRVIAGHLLCPQPNQSTVLLAFRRGCIEHGPPFHIYIDNGKDYSSQLFHGQTKAQRRKVLAKGYMDEGTVKGLFGQLEITTTFALPYNPQSKPIERWFRTVCEQFSKTFVTYCGSSPQNRPEDFQRILNSGEVPTFEAVAAKLDEYVKTVYHATGHQGRGMDGQSPLVVLRQTQEVKRVAREDVLDLLLRNWSKPISVGKGGAVRWNNLSYGSGMPELIALIGKNVRIAADPRDVREVTVWDAEGRFICRAKSGGLMGATSDEDVREAMRMKRHIRKTLIDADGFRRLAHRNVTELANVAAAQAARDKFGHMPDAGEAAIYQPLRTDIDEQLNRQLGQLKKAVGDDVVIDDDQMNLPGLTSFPDTGISASDLDERLLLRLSDE